MKLVSLRNVVPVVTMSVICAAFLLALASSPVRSEPSYRDVIHCESGRNSRNFEALLRHCEQAISYFNDMERFDEDFLEVLLKFVQALNFFSSYDRLFEYCLFVDDIVKTREHDLHEWRWTTEMLGEFYVECGRASIALGRWSDAKGSFSYAISLDIDDADRWVEYFEHLFVVQDYDSLRAEYDRAASVTSPDRRMVVVYANTLAQIGQHDAAVDHLRRHRHLFSTSLYGETVEQLQTARTVVSNTANRAAIAVVSYCPRYGTSGVTYSTNILEAVGQARSVCIYNSGQSDPDQSIGGVSYSPGLLCCREFTNYESDRHCIALAFNSNQPRNFVVRYADQRGEAINSAVSACGPQCDEVLGTCDNF